jgi:hypothetical protein
MPAAVPAMPPNPSTAAMSATTRKVMDQLNMAFLIDDRSECFFTPLRPGSAHAQDGK